MDTKSNITAQITNRAEIKLSDNSVTCSGNYHMIEKVNHYKAVYGNDPKQWPIQPVRDSVDILINEFVLKAQGQYHISYPHEEMCHCRTVPTEMVIQSIKQDCSSVKEISRATKAGTGCGTCVPNLKILLAEILNQK